MKSSGNFRFLAITIVLMVLGGIAGLKFSGAFDRSKSTEIPVVESKQLWTCGMHPQVIQDHPGNCPICHMTLTPINKGTSESSLATAGDGNQAMSAGPTVKIDPTIVQNMGVRTADAIKGPLQVTIRAVGMLAVPEPAVYEINLKINGWVQKLYATTEGMSVSKGDVLFDLYSPELQVATDELIRSTKTLKELDPGASNRVQGDAQTLVDSSRRRLAAWGIADQDIDAIGKMDKSPAAVPFRSSIDGHLTEKSVVDGSAVQAGTKLMRLEDHSKLWLMVQVYQQQMPGIRMGQTISATVDGVPGKTFTGTIAFIAPHVEQMTRTTMVRVELDNPRHTLLPGMFATANIVTQPVDDAVIVPREAVIDTGSRQIVFVATSAGHFDPRKVRMGIDGDGDRVQIVDGLAPGETVVTSGQFLMDVESRTTEAIEKLRGGAEMQMPMYVVAHCEMKDAYWIQQTSSIVNPYYGPSMATCGSVTKKIDAPAPGSSLQAVSDQYFAIARDLDSDRVDLAKLQSMKSAAGSLAGDSYDGLKKWTETLAEARDVNSARNAFASVSNEMIHALDRTSK